MNKHKDLFTLGILAFMLVLGLSMTACESGIGGSSESPGSGSEPDITVYMQKPSDWSQLFAYVWDETGKEYSNSGYGTMMIGPGSDDYYSFKATSPDYGYVNVRFSDGGSKSSLDITGVNTNTWYSNSGTYSGSSSKITLYSSNSTSIAAPVFKASEVTYSTATLTWDPIPGADGYILYDEFVKFDDDGNEIPNSEYWHFQKASGPDERIIFDDNYGEYLDPEYVYTWKLVAIKYKDNVDLDRLDSIDPDSISESDYSPYYNVVHDFGTLEVKTKESPLSAPSLRVVSTSATSVELAWNAVKDAAYYMVWWQDPEDEKWYYIEEAYGNRYIDDDEEFISPNSSYKYLVVAHNTQTYSKDSNTVTATTKGSDASLSVQSNIGNTARAVAKPTPSAPLYISAGANSEAAKQITVNWPSVSGVTKYDVGLFTSIDSKTPWIKKTVRDSTSYTFKSVPTTYAAYYVGVRAVNGSKYSDWKITNNAVSAFPAISVLSWKVTPSGNYKTFTITMKASWKTGANYSYEVTVRDPKAYGIGTVYSKTFNTNTITIKDIPRGPKYEVYIRPMTGGIKWYKTFTKKGL